jgi:phosphate transport system substrate-binding protein
MELRSRTIRFVAPLLAFLGMLSLSACGDGASAPGAAPAAGATARITVVGSSTVSPLMAEIAKDFEKSRPDMRIDVQAGGSSRGITDVRNGVAEVGMVSRALKPDESDLGRTLIARDGVSVIVHRDNPVAGLGKAQLVDIYTGRITNWSQVGGPDLAITVVSKAEGRSTLEVFSDYVGLSYKDIKAQMIIGDNQQGIQAVSSTPGAIAYVSIGTAEYEASNGAAIRLVPLDGMAPTTQAVAEGRFPMVRELNLVYKSPATPNVQALIEHSGSSKAAGIIRAQYMVPVSR